MDNLIDMISLYNEYKNGNRDVFNKLFISRVKRDKRKNDDYIESKLIIFDIELECISKKIYGYYKMPYKFPRESKCPKFYEQIYNGSFEDLKADAVMVLHKLFNDKNFAPQTSGEIYQRLEYDLKKYLDSTIETSAYTISENVSCEGKNISLFDLIPAKNNRVDYQGKYHGVFEEIAGVVNNYDVKKLLKGDAFVQRNIIDLIVKYYRLTYNPTLDMNAYPRQKDMISYYQYEYGETISQPAFSAALEGILKAICECTVSLKGKPVRRSDFIKNKEETEEENDVQEF